MGSENRCCDSKDRMRWRRYTNAYGWRRTVGLIAMAAVISSTRSVLAQSIANSTACAITPICGENGQVHPLNPCECECDEGWVTNVKQDVLSPDKRWCNVRKELQDANSDREHSSSENSTSNNTHVPRPSSASQTSLIETALHPGKQCSCQVSDEKRASYLLTKKSESPSFHTSLGGDRLHCVLHCCLLQLR